MSYLSIQTRSSLMLAALCVGVLTTGCGQAGPVVAAPEGKVDNKSSGEWLATYWQQFLPIPAAQSPLFDKTGALVAAGQSGPVWFLSAPTGGGITKPYTVPKGKTLFVPIILYIKMNPCPDPMANPAAGQDLSQYLLDKARTTINSVIDISADIDGEPIADISRFRGVTPVFDFRADLSLQAMGFSCVNGMQQKAASDGYYFLVQSMPEGPHTIRVKAKVMGAPVVVDSTYAVTVGG